MILNWKVNKIILLCSNIILKTIIKHLTKINIMRDQSIRNLQHNTVFLAQKKCDPMIDNILSFPYYMLLLKKMKLYLYYNGKLGLPKLVKMVRTKMKLFLLVWTDTLTDKIILRSKKVA